MSAKQLFAKAKDLLKVRNEAERAFKAARIEFEKELTKEVEAIESVMIAPYCKGLYRSIFLISTSGGSACEDWEPYVALTGIITFKEDGKNLEYNYELTNKDTWLRMKFDEEIRHDVEVEEGPIPVEIIHELIAKIESELGVKVSNVGKDLDDEIEMTFCREKVTLLDGRVYCSGGSTLSEEDL